MNTAPAKIIILRNISANVQSVRLRPSANKQEIQPGEAMEFDHDWGKHNYLSAYPEVFEQVEAISGDYQLNETDFGRRIAVLESVLNSFEFSASTKKEIEELLNKEKQGQESHVEELKAEDQAKRDAIDEAAKERQAEIERQEALSRAQGEADKKKADQDAKERAAEEAKAAKEAEDNRLKEEAEKKKKEEELLNPDKKAPEEKKPAAGPDNFKSGSFN